MKKALLAFSGGLDTSFCIPYLIQEGFEVHTVVINTGGFDTAELKEIETIAKQLGATKHCAIDAQHDLYEKFASYIIKANYLKGGVYPACVGPERNCIVEKIAEIAKQENITVIAHGCTAAGNDHIRFETAVKALMPHATIIAPVRDSGFTREEEIDFLTEKGFEKESSNKEYSINKGLLGTTIGGKETLDTQKQLPESAFPTIKSIDAAAENPETIEITFKKGLPIMLNNTELSGIEIIKQLNSIAAKHSFGKDYHIGTTIIGIKGRIAFEAPALKILIKAHQELEKIILTSKQLFWKNTLGTVYGDLVHEGLYYDPIIKNIEAFIDSASKYTEGTVTLTIHKGTLTIKSINSDYSLFNSELGVYGEVAKKWTPQDAKAFSTLYGLESINAYVTQQQ